jgi:hypothetical protein
MGAWGYGVRQDDFVCDVVGEFEDALKAGNSVGDATRAVTSKFAAAIEDDDYGALFRIALADAQWTYGALEPQVLRGVQDDFESGRSLALWSDDAGRLSRRRAVLERFIGKIQNPNPRAKKRARTLVRAPKFQPGDCLSIRLASGQYAAALVLAADHSHVENGMNLIGVLSYLSPQQPSIEVFRRRNWLVRTQPGWNNEIDLAWYLYVGFRTAKNRLEVVGQVEVIDSDPKESRRYCGWANIGEGAQSPEPGT